MSNPSVSDSLQLNDGSIVEAPEHHRLAKLSGENARLRSEVRQALARAERAEADAKRVRASTKFAVGDLLVKAARQPRRLLLLPRDLLRLYRLRRHRRSEPEQADAPASPTRARRSDINDELAARLLLPRLSERTQAPLSIAGALDPLTAAAWVSWAAVTPVLPHEAATLIAEVDPDIAVIDTAAGLPFGSWSHLGNPAAADRTIAAHALISSAKANGRPVVLLRGQGDNPGFDAIAARCDHVVALSGRPTRRSAHHSWNPGVDLGLLHRIRPELLGAAPAVDAAPMSEAPRVHVNAIPGHPDPSITSQWQDLLRQRGIHQVEFALTAPVVTAFEQVLRESDIVALHARAGDDAIGTPLLALSALLAGRRLVAPDDLELRRILGPASDHDPQSLGWFSYPAGDGDAARTALESALTAAPPDAHRRWRVWRALSERASAILAWEELVDQLKLSCRPSSVRDAALVIDSKESPTEHHHVAVIDALARQTHPPSEIICDRDHLRFWQHIASQIPDRAIPVHAIGTTGTEHSIRSRAAQAATSPVLIDVTLSTVLDLCAGALGDAVLAHELADGATVEVSMSDGAVPIRVSSRADALRPASAAVLHVPHPGWDS